MHDKIFNVVFGDDDLNWQTILMDLVREQGMDPWDIDVSEIATKYIEVVRRMSELNLRVSGKVILASALLLGIKSKRLVGEDVLELDRLFSESKMPEGEDYPEVDLLRGYGDEMLNERKGIFPRTPQPRKRKVSVYDLMEALDKAMEVRQRRVMRKLPDAKRMLEIPESLDVTELIVGMYRKVKDWFGQGNTTLTFNQLLPAEDRESKVFTFIPLLHLENERRIDMHQTQHFGQIEIEMLRKKQTETKGQKSA